MIYQLGQEEKRRVCVHTNTTNGLWRHKPWLKGWDTNRNAVFVSIQTP